MTNEELIQKVDLAARAEVEKYHLPYLFHYDSANQNGQGLAEKLHADSFVVALGTRLMDFKIGQALDEKRLPDHVTMSSEAGIKLLTDLNVSAEVIEKVKNCIEGHHRTVAWTCPEAEICANADCYRFLLVKNWLEFLCQLSVREFSFKDAIVYAKQKFEEKLAILSLAEAKQELDSDIKLIRQIIEKTNA